MLRRLLLALAVLALPASLVADEPKPALKVLFLGDRGHHVPARRAAQLIPVMAERGIDVTYTEALTDLNPETLGRYDALILYANIDEIGPDQERALIGYVEGGGGFVPIHCASFCFRNSDAFVKLVGAQFLEHETGTFETKIVDPDHPIMRGYEPFKTWDETYVHTKGSPDRHILQVRPDRARDEPWTWTREQGKGRVFYTAYGHDERTWGHPGFKDLIERGIRWAANEGDIFDSRPRVHRDLPPFEYEAAGDKIPNYLPSEKWGTQGEPLTTMQKPLAPAESAKHLVLPEGIEPELFAAEPDIARPITMNWDERGRLWIVESVDYPNDKTPRRPGRDRIKVCEDTDGDGRADTFTVFAEGLNIPTSLTFSRGGVIIHQAPETLFLKDTDGDGKADVREVLLTGWGTRDTHAGPSNLRYGLDNWLYGIVGYSAFDGEVGGERHRFSQGFYRFKPDGSELEFLRSTNNNSWGVGFSEEGLLFGSTANGCPSVYMPVPNRYYESVRGMAAGVLPIIADSNRFFPVTDKVRQVDWHGGFTAAAGHALYTARTYPPVYWNSTAFVAEPTGHLVATFTLEKLGTEFATHYGWNLVASNDEWTSPILAEVGPDGNVWIIDWYNYIVQHNPTPEGFRTGRGNAYETTLRDKTHGRIYRLVHRAGTPSPQPTLSADDPDGLVAALKNPNMFWRLHAQRLLVERGKRDVVPALVALAGDRSVDAIGLNPAAIHALWTLRGLGALDEADGGEAAAAALDHPSAGVRRNAVLVLPRDDAGLRALLDAKLTDDPEPLVRLASLLAISEMPESEDAAGAVVEALVGGQVDGDVPLGDAATFAAAAHAAPFLAILASRPFDGEPSPVVLATAARVAEHYARGGPVDSVGGLLAALPGGDPRVASAILAGLSAGWPDEKPATLTAETEKALLGLLPKLPPESRSRLVALATNWGSEGFEGYINQIASTFLATAGDESKPEAERVAAARQLIEFRRDDADSARALLDLINPRTPPALAIGLLEAIAQSQSPEVGEDLARGLAALTPATRPAALRALLGRSDWTTALMDAVEAGDVRLSQLPLDQQQALAAHPDRAIAERARTLLERGGGLPDADRQKVIDSIAPIALRPGDPAKGQLIFKDQCAKCHTHSGEGGKVGPDLTGMAAHPKTELLIHILDPSRSVEGNFVQYSVATADGRVLSGLLASETRTTIDLLDAEGETHTILREDVDELAPSTKSLMPEGFEQQIPPESLADLLSFLAQRGKYMPLDLRSVATATSTLGMFNSHDAGVERLVFPDWSPKTFEGVPFQLVDPQGDRIPNVILLHGTFGAIPPQMPRSVSLPCNAPARAIHFLSGVSGWGFPATPKGSVTLIVRLHYADGKVEDHELLNGVHFADYIRPVDVPGSKLAYRLRGQQIRYLVVAPDRTEPIERIELLKGPDPTSPVVMAITVEVAE